MSTPSYGSEPRPNDPALTDDLIWGPSSGGGLVPSVDLNLPPAPQPYTPIVEADIVGDTMGQPAPAQPVVGQSAPGTQPYVGQTAWPSADPPRPIEPQPLYQGYTPAPPSPPAPGYAQPPYDPGRASYTPPHGMSAYGQPGAVYGAQPQPAYLPTPYVVPGAPQLYSAAAAPKSQLAAGLLGIFLGSLGVHNFYLGRTGRAVAQLLITVCTLGVGAIITSIWGLIEGILILAAQPGTIWSVDGNGRPLTR